MPTYGGTFLGQMVKLRCTKGGKKIVRQRPLVVFHLNTSFDIRVQHIFKNQLVLLLESHFSYIDIKIRIN